MSTLVVGNIVATIAAMFMLYAGVLKRKRKYYLYKQFK